MDLYDELEKMMKRIRADDTSVLDEVHERAQSMLTSLESFMPKDGWAYSMDCVVLEYLLLSHLHRILLPGTEFFATGHIAHAIVTAYWVGRRDQWLEGMLRGVEMKGENG